MSALANDTCIEVVDTQLSLRSLLDDVTSLPTNPPSLFLDLEGNNLGRHGSISIISLFVAPRKAAYLIDVHRLGSEAFTITTNDKISFKTILESSAIPKVFFDVRNDSDALFSLYQVSMNGVKDVQLLELGSKPGSDGSKRCVAGLAKCVAKDSAVPDAQKEQWQRVKENITRLFDPQNGGQYRVFNERPLGREVMEYCVQDVFALPGLYNIYDTKLRQPGQKFWQMQVQRATEDRIKRSQMPDYDGQDKSKALGPWSEWEIGQAREEWNEDVMSDAMHEEEEWDEDALFDAMHGEYDDFNDFDDYKDSARDCIGWEEDMLKNGEQFD
ncbi:hypothetical protein LTR08_005107 [Meristemomyces frigidus]|nr:hypothetical protein LTR08_005107 [Meristemomyces frigidus]